MNQDPLENLTTLKRNIYQELNNEFTTREAMIIAETRGMNERTLKRFLNDKTFFKRIKQGIYEKLV